MVERGWGPSGSLLEVDACGAPILSDVWDGLDAFFKPGEEIILAGGSSDVVAALELDDQQLQTMARRARERALDEPSSRRRADELIELLERPWQVQRASLASAEA